MAFRIRILHSLLLGLVGFSLVLCSFFYATPVTLHYGETAAVNDAVQDTLLAGKRSLQASEEAFRLPSPESLAERTPSIGVANDNKTTTDHTLNGSAVPAASQPEEVVQPSASGSTAAVELPSKPISNTSRRTVIQRITPRLLNKGSASAGDFTSLGIVTKAMYESGHDIPNSELCPEFGKNLRVVILITSAPNHFEPRMAIRQTWGHFALRKDVAIAFLLGATADANLQKELYSESEMYGDLIQSHFQDSYNNLTLKTISLLEWVDTYCYQVSFILKTDDDMFINVPRLVAFIDKHTKDKRTIFGRLARKWKPIRNKKSKYYVSIEQYKHVLFPDFTTGPAYLMTGDVVHDLYTNALNQTYLKLEDVFTTGIVAEETKVKRVHVNEFLNKRIVFHACHIQKGISIHMVKFHEQFDLWKKLLDGKTKCK